MPQRPRTHVQESASRSALQNLIPDEWTISRVENDYGLDERVEIFEGGFATALGFWVQLKSTDEQELWKALAEPVAISALNYMSAQAEPVLLVRHHAPTDRLYGFWLHRRNVVLRNPDQKTVTLHWQEDESSDSCPPPRTTRRGSAVPTFPGPARQGGYSPCRLQ